jgi:hypothetical protein
MFDARQDQRDFAQAERLNDLLPEIIVAPEVQPPVQPEQRGFELPSRVWRIMLACYGIFFLAMTLALGSGGMALFSIVVSALYAAVFFGVATIMARQNPARDGSPLDSKGVLHTWCGPMDRKAVYGQILVIPGAVALFGTAAAVIIIASGAAK